MPYTAKHQTKLRLFGRRGFVHLRYSDSRTEYRFQAYATACSTLIVHTEEYKEISKEQHLTCRWRPGTRILAQMTDILCVCMNARLCGGEKEMEKDEARGRRKDGRVIAKRQYADC